MQSHHISFGLCKSPSGTSIPKKSDPALETKPPARKFVPFASDTIKKEMGKLPDDDFAALKHAMSSFAKSQGDEILPPATSEGQGKYDQKFRDIHKIRHRNQDFKGRGFFYYGPVTNGTQHLVVVLVYKKEKSDAPRHLLEAALDRMVKNKGGK
ncbi:hypothetical protein BH11ARM2_BH11ARM2_30330 [soil metagenome]